MPFYNNIPSKSNIVISFKDNPIADFGIFAKGYHEAANQLSNAFLSKSYYGDYEGYPIVFLYRHAFEPKSLQSDLNIYRKYCYAPLHRLILSLIQTIL